MKSRFTLISTICIVLLYSTYVKGVSQSDGVDTLKHDELVSPDEPIVNLDDSIQNYYYLMEASIDSSITYEKEKEFKGAFVKFNHYLYYRELLRLVNDRKKKIEAREKYNIERAEKEYVLLEKENEIIEYQSKKNNLIIYILVGLASLILIIILLIIQLNRIKTNRRLIEISERNLRQQLNPEFVLNTLNSIQYTIFSKDKNKSHQNLSRFAKFMRLILENSQHKYISLQKEIDTLTYYLEIESFRSKGNLKFDLTVDNEVDTFELKVPPLLVQSIIETLINELNGDSKFENAIQLEFKLSSKKLTCMISFSYAQISKFSGSIDELKNSILFKEKLDLIHTLYKKIEVKNLSITKSEIGKIQNIIAIYMPLIYD